MNSIRLLLLFLVFCSSAQSSLQKDKLVFAVDVIRHGDRNPIISLPKAPHDWPEGLGELTPIGMRREYELGKKLRRRYIEETKLLPRSYKPETLYVRSTDYNRTIMSAECFLMGLYSPGTGPTLPSTLFFNQAALPYYYQPIPIHTKDQNDDRILLPHNDQKELLQLLSSIPEYQKKEIELKPYFENWSKATGIAIHNCYEVEIVGDLLFIYQLKHLSLPKELNKEDIKTMITASKDIFKKSIVAEASGKPLFNEIAHYLKEAASQKTMLKCVLYSAHDSTIMSLMSAMNIPINEIPCYASDLNLSLFDKGNHNYYVQVTLNDRRLELPGTKGKGCSLENFMKLGKN